ncbi:MAG TPA: VOC family protein [Methylocella sp.]|nr:VOC family protein [Methylocella sp.]
MLDHIGISVGDFTRAKAFYEPLLAVLSIGVILEFWGENGSRHAGFGKDGQPFFWIGEGHPPAGPLHIAFAADSRREVEAFYQEGLRAGGSDNGAPGLRPQYHPHYYGAFLLDPDGNNVEYPSVTSRNECGLQLAEA